MIAFSDLSNKAKRKNEMLIKSTSFVIQIKEMGFFFFGKLSIEYLKIRAIFKAMI